MRKVNQTQPVMKFLRLTFDDHVEAPLAVNRSGTNISKRPQVEAGEKRFALAEQNGPDNQMKLIDQSCL